MLSSLEYRVLRRMFPSSSRVLSGNAYHKRSKLEVLLGSDIFAKLKNRVVIDYGCGYGDQAVEIAQRGAAYVIGLDIREDVLDVARSKAAATSNVEFLSPDACNRECADVVISLDSFEHFANPERVLAAMYDLLAPGGSVLLSFGPPWLHPLGGHDFSLFPWAHLVFTERALCRWYNETHERRVSRFEDVSGGLNRMTISRFERLVRETPFSQIRVAPVPIRRLCRIHNRLTREFTTAVVTCELTK